MEMKMDEDVYGKISETMTEYEVMYIEIML
jgi:hypothetical protein